MTTALGNFVANESLILNKKSAKNYQQWFFQSRGAYFCIKSFDETLVVTLSNDGTTVILGTFDSNDTRQRWRINY